jgi:TorA maturation chaperone TorD
LKDSPVTSDQIDSQHQLLSDFYLFLARTMHYPENDFLNDDFLDAYEHLLEKLELHEERERMSSCRADDDNLLQTLQVEYTRLFINAVPHVIASPYASVYQKSDHDLQGKLTEKTRDFYREQGYDIADTAEPADHIRFELEFLAALVSKGKIKEEQQFLQQLFHPWFPLFRDRVLEGSQHPFYRISVQLIDQFTKADV